MKLFAIFVAVIFALAAAVSGAAPPTPCKCTHIFKPVCGSDGNTYNNECGFNCAAVDAKQSSGKELFLVKREACAVTETAVATPCQCNFLFKPVCGSDGNTYHNECGFNCAAVEAKQSSGKELFLVKREACAVTETAVATPCICNFIFKPVCGSDGNTYHNECGFNCAAVEAKQSSGKELLLVKREACPVAEAAVATPCKCTFIFKPVCGSDGNTYHNECGFNCAAVAAKQSSGKELLLVKREAC